MPQQPTNKWYHIFTAGTYNFGTDEEPRIVTINKDELEAVASNYDPAFWEGSLHVGHPDFSLEPEPPALGWIGALKVEGEKLFCKFSHVSRMAKEFVNDKLYRNCSVELTPHDENGERYLFGLGMTNFPRLKDLPELSFKEKNKKCPFEKIDVFSDITLVKENKNLNKNNMPQDKKISESVLNFSQRVGIDVTEFNVDGDVLEYTAGLIDELKAKYPNDPSLTSLSMYITKFSEMPAEIATLNSKVTELESEVLVFKKTADVEKLVASAVAENKILPSAKSGLLKFGMKSTPEDLKEYIDNLPKMEIFKNDMVNKIDPVITEPTDKFKNAEGKLVTFSEYAKRKRSSKKEDVDFCAQFSDDEVKKLDGYDKV